MDESDIKMSSDGVGILSIIVSIFAYLPIGDTFTYIFILFALACAIPHHKNKFSQIGLAFSFINMVRTFL